MRTAFFFLALGVLTACLEEPDVDDTRVEVEDEGVACLGSFEGGQVSFEAGEAATVYVTLDGCASGCASGIETECTATASGNTIEVTGSASYDVPSGTVDCPAVCVFVQASCETGPLAAGSYTVSYAGGSVDFDVPSTDADVCTADLF